MKLSDDQKKEVAQIIQDCFHWSKRSFSNYYELCGVLNDFYNMKLPAEMERELEEDNPGLVPEDVHLGVNRLAARLNELLFSTDPFFKCKGEMGVTQETIDRVTAFLTLASVKSDLEFNIDQTLRSVIKFACGVGYVDAKEVSLIQLKNVRSGVGGNGMRHPEFVKEKKFICPHYTPCNLRRFFPDPEGSPLKWAVHQSKVTLLDLLEDQDGDKRYALFNEDKVAKTTFPSGDFSQFFKKEQFTSSVMRTLNIPIELLHFRGWMPIVDAKTQKPKWIDCIATLANREELIQFEVNQWHFPAVESFILTYMLPNDVEFLYPAGKIEISMSSFMNIFYITNQRLRYLDRLLGPMHWTDDRSLPDFLPAESGRIFKVDKGSKFDKIGVGTIPHQAYIEVDGAKDAMRWVYGSEEYTSGMTTPGKETATGINVLKGAVQSLTRHENKVIIKTGVSKILDRYLQIGQLFLEKTAVTLPSGEITEIDRRDLFGAITLSVDINNAMNKPVMQQAFLQMAELYKDDKDIDPIEFKIAHFKAMEFPDVDKIVPDRKTKMLPIEKENMIMVQHGIVIPVLREEDDELHLEGHAQFKDLPNVAQHIQLHIANAERKQEGNGKQPKIPGYESEIDLIKGAAQRMQPKRI